MLGMLFKDVSTNLNLGVDVNSNKAEEIVMLVCVFDSSFGSYLVV